MSTANQSAVENSGPAAGAEVLVEESRAAFSSPPPAPSVPIGVTADDSRSSGPDERVAEAFGMHVHKYIAEFIRLADQKAAFAFAACAGLLCYGFKSDLHKMWLKPLASANALDLLCLIAMLFLAIGLILSSWVIVPNLRKSHRGFVFFGSIAEYESSTSYASDILTSSSTQLRRAILQHTFDIAKVCAAKYWWLGRALWSTAIGAILFIVVLLLK